MLRVWLPLTKDLRNQGLSDCAVEEITSPVFDSNGKLGKALSEGKIRIPASKVGDIFNNNTMTVAFWYNNNTSDTSGNHAICGFSGNAEGDTDAVRIWDFFNYSVPTQFHWSMGTLGGGSLANAFPANTWVHVCVTWSAPTLKIYLDGVLKYTGSGSSNYTFNKSYYISFGHTPQKLNDFRIYDHCLSPMEVKELAKGLVLHYPLDRQDWGQENLVWDTHWDEISTKWSGWGSPSIREIVNSFGKKYLHVKSSDRWQGYSQNQAKRSGVGEITAGEKLTLSCWAYSNTTLTSYPCIGIHWTDGSSIIAQSWPLLTITTTPQKFTTVLTVPSGVSAFNIMVGNGRGTVSGVYEIWVADVKLERGEIATPWCPNSSDTLATTMGLNGTTEYDCSGFCNNGTRTGTFTWTSDTPKYQVSTKFSQSRIQCNGDFLYGLSTATLSAWVKLTAYHSERCMVVYANGRYLTINNNGQLSGYSYGKTPAGYYNSSQTIPLNTWTHITIVWDDTTWYFYINGVLVNSWACTGTFTNVGSYASVGQERNGGRSVSGLISDARIYATALSADDVKSLYQNSAYIDSSGNVYGAVHEEV